MISFILKRLWYGFLVLVGVVLVVFLLFKVIPADPARQMMGQRGDQATIEAISKELGLDQPLHVQFFMYLNDLSPVSWHEDDPDELNKYNHVSLVSFNESVVVLKSPYLRRSYQTQRPVSTVLMEAIPGTLILAVTSLIFAAFFGIIFGVFSALYKHSWQDGFLLILAILGISVPSFFAAIIISWLFGHVWSDFTGLSMQGSLFRVDPFEGRVLELKNLILPALTLGIRPLAIITQLTRSSMLEVMSLDYIRTARSKGLSQYTVVFKHALNNALNPVITAVSGWLASLLAGAFFVEFIFDWHGIGKVTLDALFVSDFPVVMGAVLLFSVIFVLINIVVDILYGYIDPRARIV